MSEVDDSRKKDDQEGKKAARIEQIKRAIWFHDQLIERFPDVYRILRRIYNERRK